jgi:hypothetical protein
METSIEGYIRRLCDAARLSEIVIGQSIEVLKQNGLMQSEGLMFTSKNEEMTEVKILKPGSNIDHNYSVYQEWLETSRVQR